MVMSFLNIDGKSEFQLALLVSNIIEEKSDLVEFHSSYDELVTSMMSNPLETLDQFLLDYKNFGFVQKSSVQTEIWHSDIVRVFEAREGIPITMGVLLIETANRCGLEAKGVNYPGHFLVNINGELIDPMGLEKLDREKLQNVDEKTAASLSSVSPLVVLLRMLNNLKALYLRTQSWHEAIKIIDLQVDVSGTDKRLRASLLYEQAELWFRLQAFSVARQLFLDCSSMSEDRGLVNRSQARVVELSTHEQTWH